MKLSWLLVLSLTMPVAAKELIKIRPVVFAGTVLGTPSDTPSNRIDANLSSSLYGGVGSLSGSECTGVVIAPTLVLSAAHCNQLPPGNVTFHLNYNGNLSSVIPVVSITTHPNYSGIFCTPNCDNDLVIITLAQAVPASVPIYKILNTPLAVGSQITMVGYGASGQGDVGYTTSFGLTDKRVGNNITDEVYTDVGGGETTAFIYDFDGPNSTPNFSGGTTLGNGLESTVGPGDSGSPTFVLKDGVPYLVGINTFVGNFDGGPNAPLFGSAGGGILLSSYQSFFNSSGVQFIPPPATVFGSNQAWTSNPFFGERGTFFEDVTGDGLADAVAVNTSGITIRRSDGSFFGATAGTSGEVWADAFYGEVGTFLKDVTGDGRADMIAVNLGGTTIRRSNGTSFGPNEAWGLPFYNTDPGLGRGTFLGDVTGDKKADVVVVNNGGIYVQRATGSTFSTTESWSAVPFYGEVGSYLADVTGDGRADLIAVNNSGTTIRRSNGNSFGPFEFWSFPFYNTDAGTGRGTFFVDVTGDGKADAVVVNNNGLFIQRSTGTAFGTTQSWGTAFYGSRGTYFADTTGDLRADIVVVNDANLTVRPAQE